MAEAYATIEDAQARMSRTLSESEETVCESLLEDAAVMIDQLCNCENEVVKKIVSCRMVIRAIGDGNESMVPVGSTQGSMSALGYTQSWTVGSGSVGELYINKSERRMLGLGDAIGSKSPVEDLAPKKGCCL